MKIKKWIEIREKGNKRLIRIVYNPYQESTNKIIRLFIPEENMKKVYGIRTSF